MGLLLSPTVSSTNDIMKVLILFAVFAATQAIPFVYHPAGLLGARTQFHSQDVIGNYAFGYNEGHHTGATFRREVGNAAGVKVGSYGLTDADGKLRVVDYVADATGFNAKIKTNEDVDAEKVPANVEITKAEFAKTLPVVSPYLPYYYGYPAFSTGVVVA